MKSRRYNAVILRSPSPLQKIIIKLLKRGRPTDAKLKNMVIVKIKQAISLCTKRGPTRWRSVKMGYCLQMYQV